MENVSPQVWACVCVHMCVPVELFTRMLSWPLIFLFLCRKYDKFRWTQRFRKYKFNVIYSKEQAGGGTFGVFRWYLFLWLVLYMGKCLELSLSCWLVRFPVYTTVLELTQKLLLSPFKTSTLSIYRVWKPSSVRTFTPTSVSYWVCSTSLVRRMPSVWPTGCTENSPTSLLRYVWVWHWSGQVGMNGRRRMESLCSVLISLINEAIKETKERKGVTV